MSELQQLRDRVYQLEEAFGVNLRLPDEFGLSPLEIKLISPFSRRDVVSRDMMFTAAYGGLPECDQPDIKTVEVHLVKIRRKLAPYGFIIKNYFGVGYYIDGDRREDLKKLYSSKKEVSTPAHGVPS